MIFLIFNLFLKDWQNLYEASVHSLQSEDDEPKSSTQPPFYLNRRASIEKFLGKINLDFYINSFIDKTRRKTSFTNFSSSIGFQFNKTEMGNPFTSIT